MNTSFLLKTSSILWVIWGIVHIFAGIVVLTNDSVTAVQAIADGVDAKLLLATYPDAVGAIINQHGWNLAWFGLVTIAGAFLIWRNNYFAVFVTALIGGMADLGYFIFLDIGGFVNFIPGTIMTIFSSLAIILSFSAYFKSRKENS